jgi:hypothetical protein
MKILITILWLLPGSVPLRCDPPQPVPSAAELSICQAIEQLTALDGKEVSLRGEWITNDHGEWLQAPGALCTNKLVTGGFVWPNAINLVQTTSRLSFDSLTAMEIILEPLRSKPGQYTVISTFIGRLETRVPLKVVSYPDGTVTGHGFGHLDFFPAELHYYDVKNVVLKADRR